MSKYTSMLCDKHAHLYVAPFIVGHYKLFVSHLRYLSRCLLLPCVTDSPDVELDILNAILNKAVAALPHALRVGKAVLEMEAEDIYHIRDRIQELCTVKLTDSRLTTHYAIITACTLQVSGSFSNVGCKFVL